MTIEFRAFLELLYSFAKQYISWYERNIKGKIAVANNSATINKDN